MHISVLIRCQIHIQFNPDARKFLYLNYKPPQFDSQAWQCREVVIGKWMLSCMGQQIAWLSLSLLTFSALSLSILFIFLPYACLEEMKDSVELSEEPDLIPPDSIQSKGKGVGEDSHSLAHWHALILHTSLFISGFLLVATAAELKFTSPRESSALCSQVLPGFTLLVSVSSPPSLSISFSL